MNNYDSVERQLLYFKFYGSHNRNNREKDMQKSDDNNVFKRTEFNISYK